MLSGTAICYCPDIHCLQLEEKYIGANIVPTPPSFWPHKTNTTTSMRDKAWRAV